MCDSTFSVAQITRENPSNIQSIVCAFQFGVDYVRGAEIEGMLDEQGKVIEEGKVF